VIVVEHRDRAVRFGIEHLHAASAATGRPIVVVDDGEKSDKLTGDVFEVLTCSYAGSCGCRGARSCAALAATARNALDRSGAGSR
jgi:putative resolvase